MSTSYPGLHKAVQHLCRIVPPPGHEPSDQELLQRMANRQDSAAFAAVVQRHGPMIRGLCRRLLRQEADADDAFQATFLVLLRKAHSIRKKPSLASWLYGVAFRIARRAREKLPDRCGRVVRTESLSASDPALQVAWQELYAVLDGEVTALPDDHRAAIVLCYLEGQTRDQAARQLGWSLRTLERRLEQGRERLRLRLLRRGLALPVALLAAGLSREATAAVPAHLLTPLLKAASLATGAGSSAVSGRVAALVDGVLRGLAATRLLKIVVAALSASLLLVGTGFYAALVGDGQAAQDEKPPQSAATIAPPQDSHPRVDRYGDPLPRGALLRLGTARFRHGGPVTALAFLPGDKTLVSGSFDGTLRLWDTNTGKQMKLLAEEQGLIRGATLSPDAGMLAFTKQLETGQNEICLWHLATGKELHRFGPYPRAIPALAFSPDGRLLAAAFHADNLIRFWQTATWTEAGTVRTPDHPRSLAFSPDGKTLAVGSVDPAIQLWDIQNQKETHRLKNNVEPRLPIASISFSPDGKTLAATVAARETIQLWDLASGKELRQLRTNGSSSWDVAFSPDGKLLACGNYPNFLDQVGLIQLFNPATGEEIRQIVGHPRGVDHLAFSSDGRVLASTGRDCAIRLWEVATGRELHHAPEHQARILALAYAPDGNTLATGSMDGTIRLWDPTTARLLRQIEPRNGEVKALTFTRSSDILASASGLEVQLWDPATGREVRNFNGFTGPGRCLAFSPDGKTLVGTGENQTIRFWDASSGEVLRRFREVGRVIVSALSSDGKLVASASSQEVGVGTTVCLRDFAGTELRRWNTPQRSANSIVFSPDSRWLALAGLAPGIYLWETATGKERAEFREFIHEQVSSVAFSPDGKTLAVARDDSTIFLIEMATGKERGEFEGRQSRSLISLAFAPDGRTLASAGGDSTALIWDLTSGLGVSPQASISITRPALEDLWNALASDDAARAYQAIWRIVAAAKQSVPFLGERLKPVTEVKEEQVSRLLTDLADQRFPVRKAATDELEKLADLAEPALRRLLQDKPGLEARQRAEELLGKLFRPVTNPGRLQLLRAIEALEHIGSADAKRVLEIIAKGASQSRLTQEAQASLQRLARRSSVP